MLHFERLAELEKEANKSERLREVWRGAVTPTVQQIANLRLNRLSMSQGRPVVGAAVPEPVRLQATALKKAQARLEAEHISNLPAPGALGLISATKLKDPTPLNTAMGRYSPLDLRAHKLQGNPIPAAQRASRDVRSIHYAQDLQKNGPFIPWM